METTLPNWLSNFKSTPSDFAISTYSPAGSTILFLSEESPIVSLLIVSS